MRNTFIRVLCDLAREDERIVLLTGDLGYAVIEPFAEAFPNRFFNVGVAEQNMVGLATGLAESGFLPFTYSIATFATLRPFEFIRNGPALHRLPIRIIGVGGGYEYGSAGPTHHALEDVGIMRLLPDVLTICPADYQQAESALRATWNDPRAIYYRLGKDDEHTIPGLGGHFALDRVETIRVGSDVAIFAMGAIARNAAIAADYLAAQGIGSSLAIVSCLSPPPADAILETLAGATVAVTIEAHLKVGGLGSVVSEVIADAGIACKLRRCAAEHQSEYGGSEAFLNEAAHLSPELLVTAIRQTIEGRSTIAAIS